MANPSPDSAVLAVDALAVALLSGEGASVSAAGSGFAFGMDAGKRGVSLHDVLKELDLVMVTALDAAETAAIEHDRQSAGAADGVRIARRAHQAFALLARAAAEGYMHAVTSIVQGRLGDLRHDLRNPLSTIEGVLALMDDDATAARLEPRFRAMAARNARALDDMIATRLGDAAALVPALVRQHAALRTIACGVRDDLRAASDELGVTVTVDGHGSRAEADTAALGLMLNGVLFAALHESRRGDELIVRFGDVTDGWVAVRVKRVPAGPTVSNGEALARLTTLAGHMGAKLETGARLVLFSPARSSGGETRHDVRRARQREHGQAGSH
jgi:signal transduction histidine kinase